MTSSLEIQLKNVFNSLELEARNIDIFIEYIYLLKKWNKNINLISKKEKNIVEHLIAPSLLFFQLIQKNFSGHIVDLGSGAGFPAMMIKIYNPNINVTMVDSNAKKTAFLHYVSAKLGLQCDIINEDFSNIVCEADSPADITTIRGIDVTKSILNNIKTKIQSRWIVHFTSPTIQLHLDLIKEAEVSSASAKLYCL